MYNLKNFIFGNFKRRIVDSYFIISPASKFKESLVRVDSKKWYE